MDPELLHRINLIEALADDADGVPEPPEDAAERWTAEQIREYFSSGGSVVPARSKAPQPLEASELKKKFPSENTIEFDKWFPGIKLSKTSQDNPHGYVLCFPNAGNEENMYSSEGTGQRKAFSPLLEWCRQHKWSMLAVQPPGRAMRLKEAFCRSAQQMAEQLLPLVAPKLAGKPYVVVAHSVGTWNAYEFLALAREQGLHMPMAAFLSAFPGPDLPVEERPWRQQRTLGEEDFKEECRGWDINEIIFSNSMWGMFQPILRADFTLFDEYEFLHEDSPPFEFPISAYWGSRDRRISRPMVERWGSFTSNAFKAKEIKGNHLWPLDKEPKGVWLQHVVDDLAEMGISAK